MPNPHLTPLEVAEIEAMRKQADKVSNGAADDVREHGRLLAKVARGVAAMCEAGTVTMVSCDARHAQLRADIAEIVDKAIAKALPPQAPAEPEIPQTWGARAYRLIGRAPWPVCALIGWLAWLYVHSGGKVADAAAKVAGVSP